jgi:hypothetical protein
MYLEKTTILQQVNDKSYKIRLSQVDVDTLAMGLNQTSNIYCNDSVNINPTTI